MPTVYSPDGTPHEVSSLNAIDLTRNNGFTFQRPQTETAVEGAIPAPVVAEETPTEDSAPVEETDEPLMPLAEEAEMVTGEADVEAYLATKTPANLRTIAEQRFGEKFGGRTKPEKIIAKIVELEDARIEQET